MWHERAKLLYQQYMKIYVLLQSLNEQKKTIASYAEKIHQYQLNEEKKCASDLQASMDDISRKSHELREGCLNDYALRVLDLHEDVQRERYKLATMELTYCFSRKNEHKAAKQSVGHQARNTITEENKAIDDKFIKQKNNLDVELKNNLERVDSDRAACINKIVDEYNTCSKTLVENEILRWSNNLKETHKVLIRDVRKKWLFSKREEYSNEKEELEDYLYKTRIQFIDCMKKYLLLIKENEKKSSKHLLTLSKNIEDADRYTSQITNNTTPELASVSQKIFIFEQHQGITNLHKRMVNNTQNLARDTKIVSDIIRFIQDGGCIEDIDKNQLDNLSPLIDDVPYAEEELKFSDPVPEIDDEVIDEYELIELHEKLLLLKQGNTFSINSAEAGRLFEQCIRWNCISVTRRNEIADINNRLGFLYQQKRELVQQLTVTRTRKKSTASSSMLEHRIKSEIELYLLNKRKYVQGRERNHASRIDYISDNDRTNVINEKTENSNTGRIKRQIVELDNKINGYLYNRRIANRDCRVAEDRLRYSETMLEKNGIAINYQAPELYSICNDEFEDKNESTMTLVDVDLLGFSVINCELNDESMADFDNKINGFFEKIKTIDILENYDEIKFCIHSYINVFVQAIIFNKQKRYKLELEEDMSGLIDVLGGLSDYYKNDNDFGVYDEIIAEIYENKVNLNKLGKLITMLLDNYFYNNKNYSFLGSEIALISYHLCEKYLGGVDGHADHFRDLYNEYANLAGLGNRDNDVYIQLYKDMFLQSAGSINDSTSDNDDECISNSGSCTTLVSGSSGNEHLEPIEIAR